MTVFLGKQVNTIGDNTVYEVLKDERVHFDFKKLACNTLLSHSNIYMFN